jgi:hypothetical protein
MDTVRALLCTRRLFLQVLTSVSLFLLFLCTASINYLGAPWTELYEASVLSRVYGNSSIFLARTELRSLTAQPLIYFCTETRTINSSAVLSTFCSRNYTAVPLPGSSLGIDEVHVKNITLILILFGNALACVSIAATLCFSSHACRLQDNGRPFPGATRLCLSARSVLLVLLVGFFSCAFCAACLSFSAAYYTAQVTDRWAAALAAPQYAVKSGVGVAALQRYASFAWCSFVLLLLATLCGPLKWRHVPPAEEITEADSSAPQRTAAALRSVRLSGRVVLRAVVVEGGGLKSSLGFPLQVARYVSPPPERGATQEAAAGNSGSSFSFASPFR